MGITQAEVDSVARDSLRWLLAQAITTDNGLAWPEIPGGEPDPSLYSGGPGIVPTLLEAYRHFGDDSFADAAVRAARDIAVTAPDDCSLYVGAAGTAFALAAVADVLDEPWARTAADTVWARVRDEFDGDVWNEFFELIAGNAGIVMAALRLGDVDMAERGVEHYVRTAEPTAHGVQWQGMTDIEARLHHISHGTLGIAQALVAVGQAAGRPDLIELALAGVADVVARDEAGPDGFLVPHSDPQHKPERIPRYSYGWCHGPAGDAQVFRQLAATTGDAAWTALADRCWHTVVTSGLPQRLRPGFWDNNARCCGTAGVLAFALDREVERGDGVEFAGVLVSDMLARATVDGDGARWSNYEYRVEPSTLEPHTGWAQGNAGIVRELLRYLRVTDGRDPHYAVAWPDHLPTA